MAVPISMIMKGAGDTASAGINYFGNQAAKNRALEANRALLEAENNAYGIGKDYYSGLESAYAPEAESYMADLANWRNQANKAPVEMGQFDESKFSLNNYLNPAMQFRQDQERQAIDQSAAARGGMFAGTGATAKALQDRSQNIASEEYGNADTRMFRDKQFGYQDFMNHFNSQKDNELMRLNNLGSMMNQSGQARQNLFDARGGQADLGMSHARSVGDISAQRSNTMGQYWKDQSSNLANFAKMQGGQASGYMANQNPSMGGGGMGGGQAYQAPQGNMGGSGASGGGDMLSQLMSLLGKK